MIRAVDIKQILVQSNSMERVQQAQQQHPEMQQRYLDIQLSEENKLLKESVKNAQEADEARVGKKEEQESPRRNAKDRREHGKPEAPDQEDSGDGLQGTHVDIRV